MSYFTRDKSHQKQEPEKSMFDLIRDGKKRTREEVKKEITSALIETDTQKELYRTAALRAIAKAKRAVANNNPGEKAIACNELKFAYGIYHYMDSLHTAFRTVESQLQIQEMTQEFANVVSSLKSIKLPAANVNFNSITAMALKAMGNFDTAGLDDMVRQLIQGSMSATDATQASDQFLEDLISGKVSLDAPYAAKPIREPAENQKTIEAAPQNEQTQEVSGTDELLALLDQINAGLDHK